MANVIQTSRLALVPLTKNHLEAFHAVWSDPEATQWSLHGCNETLAASEEWMAGVLRTPENNNRRSWAVYLSNALEQHQCIGTVTLLPKDPSGGEGMWELGYLYRPEWWAKGYATESCLAAIDELKRDLNAQVKSCKPKLVAWVDPANKNSSKVLEKLGFKWVERKKFDEPPKRKLGGEWRESEVCGYQMEL